ncbi:MAG: riboflavin synthase [Candidatus Omnitrophica bacterium]|nr:riboflavin synthase [Candidatus Omnitrophota bacterium]
MFTGIVEEIGQVAVVQQRPFGARITVRSSLVGADASPGDSILVDGVCLTVLAAKDGLLDFDIVRETLHRTTFSDLRIGRDVNLERALRASDRLSGHIVTGHVDGIGIIRTLKSAGSTTELRIQVDPPLSAYMVTKGSVAVDGISLTIASLTEDGFSVSLIPFTVAHTGLRFKQTGMKINIECDILGKYVRKYLGHFRADGIDEDMLQKYGFC